MFFVMCLFVFQTASSSSMAVDTVFGNASSRQVATQQALENAATLNNTANALAESLASAESLTELQSECFVHAVMWISSWLIVREGSHLWYVAVFATSSSYTFVPLIILFLLRNKELHSFFFFFFFFFKLNRDCHRPCSLNIFSSHKTVIVKTSVRVNGWSHLNCMILFWRICSVFEKKW